MPGTIKYTRRRFLGTGAMVLGVTHLGTVGCAKAQSTAALRLAVEGGMPSLGGTTGWLNSQPLTPASLRGKVVLINFWTYSCINSIRTLPYLRAWSEKYRGRGLVVIGVQAPEFTFEKNINNVRWAVKDMRLDYPIAIDNDHVIWNAFKNEYWPAFYFVDAGGRIRHHQFGEGEYGQSELVLQQLLAETGNDGIDRRLVSVEPRAIEVAADWNSLKSPETYVGYEHAENFSSPGGVRQNTKHTYSAPTYLSVNQWALLGDWTSGKHSAILNETNGRIVYRFHARDLHLVMGPGTPGTLVKFRVAIDGQPPRDVHGVDVSDQGNGIVIEQRLYQLIRQTEPIVDRQFEIEFLNTGAEVFVFTFG
jgi:thiol-disulfide isomerase/thioredoxin